MSGTDYTGCAVRPYADQAGRCGRCGSDLSGRQKRWCSRTCSERDIAEHYWSAARKAAIKRDSYCCITCGTRAPLEVNHIDPRVGQGYGTGCWNHLSNLETLCHGCHLQVTAEQALQRRKQREMAA